MILERGEQAGTLIPALLVMRLVTNFEVVASTMFIWDYILTLGMEVDLVWKSKWNFMKGLYLFQRYMPFIDTVWLVLYRQAGDNLTETVCRNVSYASGVFMVVGLAASEMILTLRTWAMWNRNKRLSIILPILYNLCWASGLIVLLRVVNSSTCKPEFLLFLAESKSFLGVGAPPYPGFKGCFLTDSNEDIVFLWALLITWDALLLMLMLVPAIRTYRDGGNSTLMKTVHCEGVMYYLYLFVLSCINIIVVKTLPQQFQLLLSPVERVVHSMLTSRVLLHIRAQAGDNVVWSDGLTELGTTDRGVS
ncbi:hypothetical protein M413DRAFT_32088 [Hebeloma cylindrosporum]|uniref:DUF6533 domain-containing protein n=1 Tax=Hebeloma cylindrosporum TaxID=76867 RepID=A0A0C2XDG0_HEBCY|nr:hypothetical protein M413DRAFT_32088 [Hebeloma cylindrosporum h7]